MSSTFAAPSSERVDLAMLDTLLRKNTPRCALEVHGFLSAIISGPRFSRSSEWINFLDPYREPSASIEEACADGRQILHLMKELYNEIAEDLHKEQFDFQRITQHIAHPRKLNVSAAKKAWIRGYLFRVEHDQETWLIHSEIAALLFPLSALIVDDLFLRELKDREDVLRNLQKIRRVAENDLSGLVNDIYQYWLLHSEVMTKMKVH